MRGADITQINLFSYRTLEERIPANHPLRKLRLVREEWSGEKGMCRKMGRMADQRSPQAFAGIRTNTREPAQFARKKPQPRMVEVG